MTQCLEQMLLCLGEVSGLVAHRDSTHCALMAESGLVAGGGESSSTDEEILSCTILMLMLKMTGVIWVFI